MSAFMYTIHPGEDRHNMSACLYLCVQYLLVTTEIKCLHVCISVHNTYWWRQTWYVCISVFMCTILAGDDRNNMSACLYLCAQYLQVTTEIICLHVCISVQNTYWWRQKWYVCMSVFMCTILLVTTEIICLHVCIYVYNTCSCRQK